MADAATVQIKIFGSKELIDRLERLNGFMASPRTRAAFEDAKNAYVLLAQQAAPTRSRFLKASIDGRVEGAGTTDVVIRVLSSARHAAAIELGGKPHPIYPRNKRYLHWFQDAKASTLDIPWGVKEVPEGARSVFSVGVNHPGNAPRPFMFKHMPLIRERLLQALARLMNEAMQQNAPS